MKLMIARLLWRSQKEEWEAQLEEMVGAMLVLPQALLRLIHGSHSFYTNANAFLFEVAPNWVETHSRWQPRTTL
jgi:hypothetical protein